ncbi:hypothetical protein YT1_4056 [Rhodococcus ruber]|nr:hypothetical protein YT1_4056 [Rhodococcus ruber]
MFCHHGSILPGTASVPRGGSRPAERLGSLPWSRFDSGQR